VGFTAEPSTASNCPTNPSDKITVVMDLDNSTHDIIKKDSVATIETEGLLGNEYMAVIVWIGGALMCIAATPLRACLRSQFRI